MLRNSVALLTLTCTLAACSANPSPQEDVDAVGAQPASIVTTAGTTVVVPTELTTVRPAFITTWTRNDPAAFTTFFGDNVVVMTPTDRFTGWNDARTRWLTPMLTGMSNYIVTPTSFTRDGDDIIESGSYRYRVTHDGGHTENRTVAYSYRWQKQPDGNWRIVGVSTR